MNLRRSAPETAVVESWPELIRELVDGHNLGEDTCFWAMNQIMSGAASAVQIAGFLVALQIKGVQGAELAPLVEAMLNHSVPVEIEGPKVDTCGTGGDHSGSVNISTMAAVAVAATGRTVVKHGNRAATSKSGSADVLEALGIVVDLAPDRIRQCVDEAGIAFCFAPVFHPSMRHAGPVRKELGIPTVFNVLGPLANPARPTAQVVGVANPSVAPRVADALHRRGTSALVARAEDGMDEFTTLGATRVWDCRGSMVVESVIHPEDVGLQRGQAGDLDGGDAQENAEIARRALAAQSDEQISAVRDAVILNAAAAVVAYDHTGGRDPVPLIEAMRSAVIEVREALDSGRAAQTLSRWAAVSQDLSK